MARKDAGSSRADKPAPRAYAPLPAGRTYQKSDFEPLRNKEREYRLKETGQLVSKRKYDTATHDGTSNELRAERNKPGGMPYETALRKFTERNAAVYGDPSTQQALDAAAQSRPFRKVWRALVNARAAWDPQTRTYSLDPKTGTTSPEEGDKAWKAQQEALEKLFGQRPTMSARAEWRTTVSPPQPAGDRQEAA